MFLSGGGNSGSKAKPKKPLNRSSDRPSTPASGTPTAAPLASSQLANTAGGREVQLRGRKLGNAGIRRLVQALAVAREVEKLDISDNDVRHDALVELVDVFVMRNEVLHTLVLSHNALREQSGTLLASVLRSNHTLHTLVLDFNQLGDAGFQPLADALAHNVTLRTLSCNANGLGDASARAIAVLLEQQHSLTSLSLRSNLFRDPGMCVLAEAMKWNNGLTNLDISGNVSKSEAVATAWKWALARNYTLVTVSITGHNDGRDRSAVMLRNAALASTATAVYDVSLADANGTLILSNSRPVLAPLMQSGWAWGQLRELLLDRCALTELDANVSNLKALERLVVRYNPALSALPESLSSLPQLSVLDCSHNALKALPATLSQLTALSNLICAWNALTEFPPHLPLLTALQRLDFAHNNIRWLPTALHSISWLRRVNGLDSNPLLNLPAEISHTSWDDIKRYLQELERSGGEPVGFVKLVVLGRENVGKTTLLRALSSLTDGRSAGAAPARDNRLLSQNISTDGIDIGVLQGDDDISFRTYDFGGQEVFYPTHQFFLTPGSIHLVAFNAAAPDTSGVVQYWVNQIKNRTGGGRQGLIFLVGTHADECTKEQQAAILAQLQRIKAKTNFEDVLFVSGKTREGCRELRSLIVESAKSRLKHIYGKVVPKSFASFMQLLRGLRDTDLVLDWEVVVRMAHDVGIKDDAVLRLFVEFFHNLGDVLLFEDREQRMLVLDPQQLAKVMSSLISFKSNWAKGGVIARSTLRLVWKEFSEEQQELFIRILVRFEVAQLIRRCAAESPDPTYLIPCLLPEEAPETLQQSWPSWVATERGVIQYARRFYFEQLPLAFFGRLMVRVLSMRQAREVVKWRHGLRVDVGDQSALLLAKPDSNEVVIFVRKKRL